jgi:hypothetical protein
MSKQGATVKDVMSLLDPATGQVVVSTGPLKRDYLADDLTQMSLTSAVTGAYDSVGFDNGDMMLTQRSGIVRCSLAEQKIRWALDTTSIMDSMERDRVASPTVAGDRSARRRQVGAGDVQQPCLGRGHDGGCVDRQDHGSLERPEGVPQRAAGLADHGAVPGRLRHGAQRVLVGLHLRPVRAGGAPGAALRRRPVQAAGGREERPRADTGRHLVGGQ